MAIKTFPSLRTVYKNLTVAQLYAGYVLVPAATDRRYTVTDWWARSAGYSFGNAHTTITDGTTTVATLLHEGLANGVVLRPAAATGNAVSTNMLAALAENKPIKIVSDALETTGHTIEICVDYIVSTIEETA